MPIQMTIMAMKILMKVQLPQTWPERRRTALQGKAAVKFFIDVPGTWPVLLYPSPSLQS